MVSRVAISDRIEFDGCDWKRVPDSPGAYIIREGDEVLYVGMAGRNGRGSLRNRLRDHGGGSIVNMFSQYLFLARVQFLPGERITDPRDANQACREYVRSNLSFQYVEAHDAADARRLEAELMSELEPTLNGPNRSRPRDHQPK